LSRRSARRRRQRSAAGLAEDAIKPWQQRSWIFPRDPDFLAKAGPILDLYEGRWDGKLLEPGDCVISADAKPSIFTWNFTRVDLATVLERLNARDNDAPLAAAA